MGKKNNFTLKEKYRLRWEYWKRTKEYKRTSAFIEDNKVTDPEAFGYPVWVTLGPEKSTDIERKLKYNLTFGIMFRFSVYERNGVLFDEAWQKEEIQHLCGPANTKWAVVEYSEYINDHWFPITTVMDFDFIYLQFRLKNGRDPSFEEFTTLFKKRLMSYSERFIFSVDNTNKFSIGTAVKEFKNLLRQKRNDIEFLKEQDRRGRKGRVPFANEKARYEEIKRYLDIYKLHEEENKSYREIATIAYPNTQYDENLRIALIKEKKKAKKIIKNTERGIFPGKY